MDTLVPVLAFLLPLWCASNLSEHRAVFRDMLSLRGVGGLQHFASKTVATLNTDSQPLPKADL